MNTIWKLHDAKAKFSKLVEYALTTGPQYVTRRGSKAVVVISAKDYEKLLCPKPSFKDFLLNCPKMDEDFEVTRQQDYPRKIEF